MLKLIKIALLGMALSASFLSDKVHAEVSIYATVGEMRESVAVPGATIQTLGYYEPGDGGGVTYTVVDVSEVAINAQADHMLASGYVAEMKVGANLTPRMFGAVGNGQADDTEAFNSLDRMIAEIDGPVHVHLPQGIFMVNPLKTPLVEMAPGKLRRCSLLTLRNDFSTFTARGTISVMPGIDYTVNAKDGPEWLGYEWYWSVILIRANHCTVDGIKFDGKDTGTLHNADDKGYYPRWSGVSAFGEWDNKTYHVGNRVINSVIIRGGGHGVSFQYQKQALIANNYFEDTTGNGFSHSDDSSIIGNVAVNSHDAPYIANGRCNNIVIANNLSRGTTNGSGIDIVGAFSVLVQGNIIDDSAAWGILVSYSAQQKIHSGDVLITDNLFIRNCRSLDTPINAEVCVGLPWDGPEDRLAAIDVVVKNNKFILDGTHGSHKGRFVVLGKGTERVQVVGNIVNGKPNKEGEVLAITSPTRDLAITGNSWVPFFGPNMVEISVNATVEGSSDISGNIGIR